MTTEEIVLFVFDEEAHFQANLELLGRSSFKKIERIDSEESFTRKLNQLREEELVFVVVHIFYTEKIKGIKKFLAEKIKKKHPLIDPLYISDGSGGIIKKEMIESDIDEVFRVKQYYQIVDELEQENFNVYTKKEIISSIVNSDNTKVCNAKYPQIDYVIITALEEDEMEKVLPMIKREGKVDNDKHLIEYGHFKNSPTKKVAYASQQETGMMDAAILATEMIVTFKPKFVIMTGVLGGKPDDTKIGDIIVSKKVFTIDKGKIDDDEFEKELENVNTNNAYVTSFIREQKNIKRFIEDENQTRKTPVNIHFEPIACVRSVINKEGYFVENISTVDRKAIGLEMESYGIARACEIVNNGQSIPIIVKSVMDNTQEKTDDAKTYAAWTSAKFIEYVIINDLL
ncbi:5'-methylthioadenosine/S-adenosylhomocysteine nucleosidase family protein [Flavivirga rizhaonensis]|uniref:Nucleoside phosphorylase domain-containing protein n=1 Tax=Flavivirga rizhaonensis TaxID=2559571 RepID=A0A4S1E151_9FLAO|nr:5'-methylthioadenosine/S-adenosylhomocysteine nucleosidase [Flavivirga rizhaonensis]TGV03648.1 hypothetical protein EM932_06380 [Flavivirga rizhaonensis]